MQFCESDRTYLTQVRDEHIPNVPPHKAIEKAYNHLVSGGSHGFLVTEKNKLTSERISLGRIKVWFEHEHGISAAIAQSLETTVNDDTNDACKLMAEKTDNNNKKLGENRKMNPVENSLQEDTQMDNTQSTVIFQGKIDVLKIKLPTTSLPKLPVSPVNTTNCVRKERISPERYSEKQTNFLNNSYGETKGVVPGSERLTGMMAVLNTIYELNDNGKQVKEIAQIKTWFYNKKMTERKKEN